MKNSNNKIGIWLDHAIAKIIEVGKSPSEFKIIHASNESSLHAKGEDSNGTRLGNFRASNDEWHDHHREQNEVQSYYKDLIKEVKPYDEIFIFGPTTAPQEFRNLLHLDKDFAGKRIIMEHADYITDNQLAERVRNFFDNSVKI